MTIQVLLPTDVFPPRCGGAGWSAHTLARALIERGHAVTAVVPRRARGAPATQAEDVLGVPTVRVSYAAPGIPFLQNYARFERFWPRLAELLAELLAQRGRPALIHAQHVQVAPAAVLAGRRAGVPVVVTVRDHWPWDYFNTGLHANRLPYPGQSWASLATDLPARLGPLRGALALPAIPYMIAHLRRRQAALRQADAVIAVSEYMAARLRAIVPAERVHVIPNMVDMHAIDAALAAPLSSVPPGQPFVLFVGKLERNKGAHLLGPIFQELAQIRSKMEDGGWRVDPPSSILHPPAILPTLVVAGDGPLRGELERELAGLGVRLHMLDWVEHDEVLRLMAACELVLFPSAWGEPLSRVPLEASACGAAVLAMPTGGTPDILEDGVTGALEAGVGGFARRLAELVAAPAERRRLGQAARQMALRRFAKDAVLGRVEALYQQVIPAGFAI